MSIHFLKEEFAERKSKVIKELKYKGLDALLMFRQESMYWLTGYDTFGYVFFQCLVLTTKGDLILLTIAAFCRFPIKTLFLSIEIILPSPFFILTT